jgi:dipeptidyl aminopeptidase/acylaminoacyl peptidase
MRHSTKVPAVLATSASRRAFLQRSVLIAAAIPVLGSVLAACGDDDDDADAPAAAPDAEPSATAAAETATETRAAAPSPARTNASAAATAPATPARMDVTALAGTATAAASPASLATATQPPGTPASGQLAFAGIPEGASASALYLVGTDGTGLQAIWTWETAGSHAVYLEWSPDGRHLAFYGFDAGTESVGLYVLDADRGSLTNLVAGDFFGSPTWSPDSRQVYISVPRASATVDGGILAVPADGSAAPTWLIRLHELDMEIPTLNVSPDGQMIAASVGGLVVVRVDDLQTRVVVSETGGGLVWSPDSRQGAFIDHPSGGLNQLYVANADGTGLSQLTDHSQPVADPVWSPDGQQLAYTVFHADTPATTQQEVYVTSVDGSDTRNLSNDPEHWDYGPSWSPDGRAIAFVSQSAAAWRDPATAEVLASGGSVIMDIRNIMADGTQPRTMLAGVQFENFMELLGLPAWRPTEP